MVSKCGLLRLMTLRFYPMIPSFFLSLPSLVLAPIPSLFLASHFQAIKTQAFVVLGEGRKGVKITLCHIPNQEETPEYLVPNEHNVPNTTKHGPSR